MEGEIADNLFRSFASIKTYTNSGLFLVCLFYSRHGGLYGGTLFKLTVAVELNIFGFLRFSGLVDLSAIKWEKKLCSSARPLKCY